MNLDLSMVGEWNKNVDLWCIMWRTNIIEIIATYASVSPSVKWADNCAHELSAGVRIE